MDKEEVDFVTDAVNRYSAAPYNVTHFGIWNEPNLTQFFEGGADSIDEYVDTILVPGAAAVRSACNSCKVLGPDLAHLVGGQLVEHTTTQACIGLSGRI